MSTRYAYDDDHPPIVIDNGSSLIKAGFAGDDQPRIIAPNVVGRSRHRSETTKISTDEQFIGSEAIKRKDSLVLRHPIERGIITNWDDMELTWKNIFDIDLHIKSEEHVYMLCEPILNPKLNRERLTQTFFESFDVNGMILALQPQLSFYSCGRCTGIVVEIGDGLLQIMPFFEGCCIIPAIQRVEFGGRDVTDQLSRLLNERGFCFSTTSGREIVRDIKEKHSYVALDYEAESFRHDREENGQRYSLPDGQILTVGKERFECGEMIFRPEKFGLRIPSLTRLLFDALQKCDIDTRRDFSYNCVLTGGGASMLGLDERLQSELVKLIPTNTRANVLKFNRIERSIAAWIGGSILGSLSSNWSLWITKADYAEFGPSIVHRQYFLV